MGTAEWMTIRFIERINLGRSSEELEQPGFEEPYENLKHRLMIKRTRFLDIIFSRDHVAQS